MSNFIQRRVSRESTGEETDYTETDMFEGMEVAQEDMDQLMAEGEVLSEDTSALIDADIESLPSEALSAVHESICRRWAIEPRAVGHESYGVRSVGHEGIWSTISEMLRKFIDWIKEIGSKIKERWNKFSNAGKTIQKKAEAYKKKIEGLSAKKKDTIEGQFIKHLTVDGSFKGDDDTTIKQSTGVLKELYNLQRSRINSTIENVRAFNSKAKDNPTAAIDVFKDKTTKPKTSNYIGNKTLLVKDTASTDILTYTIEFADTVNSKVPATVSNPELSTLKAVCDNYAAFGKAVEDFIVNRKTNDSGNAELAKRLEEVLKLADALKTEENNKPLENAIKVARQYAQRGITVSNLLDTVSGHMVISLSKGLPGYLDASIKAYK